MLNNVFHVRQNKKNLLIGATRMILDFKKKTYEYEKERKNCCIHCKCSSSSINTKNNYLSRKIAIIITIVTSVILWFLWLGEYYEQLIYFVLKMEAKLLSVHLKIFLTDPVNIYIII